MIQNLWGMMKIYCGNHHDELYEMIINPDYKTVAYRCSNCKNTISITECERILKKISKVLYDAEMNNEIFDLENYQYTEKGIHVKVIKYTQNEIWVEVYNKKAIEG